MTLSDLNSLKINTSRDYTNRGDYVIGNQNPKNGIFEKKINQIFHTKGDTLDLSVTELTFNFNPSTQKGNLKSRFLNQDYEPKKSRNIFEDTIIQRMKSAQESSKSYLKTSNNHPYPFPPPPPK